MSPEIGADALSARFPPTVTGVESGQLIVERLGWQFGTWGAYSLVAACWLLAQDLPGEMRWGGGGAALVLAAAMIGYEARRRRRPTALLMREGRVGIYRGGTLAAAVKPDELSIFHASYHNSIIFLFAALVFGLMGLIPLMTALKPDGGMGALDLVAGLSLTAACAACAASVIYTRHVWITLRLPNGTFYEDFNLTRAEFARAFPG